MNANQQSSHWEAPANSGLNHYLTLIANLLKLAHQGLLFLREFFQSLKRMPVPMNRKLGFWLASP
jgi:hypothetical protein